MQHRKEFIKTIGAGFAGAALFPNILFGKNNSEYNTCLLVLDAVRKIDLVNGLSKTIEFASGLNTIIFDNLYTAANIDFHEESYSLIFKNKSFATVDVLKTKTSIITSKNILLTGFDVAHYNIDLYNEAISNADDFILKTIKNNANYSEYIIMSAMGRNDFENEIVNNNGFGGFDHNHESARECYAMKITTNKSVGLNINFNSTRINTTELLIESMVL